MKYTLFCFCITLVSFAIACQAAGADQADKVQSASGSNTNPARPRVVLVGGFLGSGKTTLLRQAAKMLVGSGRRIGLVTNDQAPMLVDTKYLQDSALAVKEVAGGCFCCKFSEFADALASFVRESSPEIVLGEPVGSCTDISATVLQPLKDHYKHRFTLAPFSVLLDPEKVDVVLGTDKDSKLHPSAQYIMRKQVEEADVLVLNKIDLLSDVQLASLLDNLTKSFPNIKVFPMSAKTGKGVQEWLDYVMTSDVAGHTITQVDYDTYAEGEAVLGWLNCTAEVSTGSAGDAKALCEDPIGRLQTTLVKENAEIAHLKMIVEDSSDRCIKASLTSSTGKISTDGDTWVMVAPLTLTLNARVQIAPQALERIVRETLAATADGKLSVVTLQSFSPGRPKPTYRYSEVKRE